MTITEFIAAALHEDINIGDYSTMACIDADAIGEAVLKVKEDGVIAGITLAQDIFSFLEADAAFSLNCREGDRVKYGDVAFTVRAGIHTILQAERLVLNCMQRMSGIATLTAAYVDKIKGYPAQILDTRKTTPLFRFFEKQAVVIGGGTNHRMGLYDMILLKDNHIDFCGGIEKAILRTNRFLELKGLDLEIEVETRNLDDVETVLKVGRIHRIMLDNFTAADLATAIKMIGGRYKTEASGGMNLDNIEAYAATGVDYISVGAIIHHAVSMDLSLKAKIVS